MKILQVSHGLPPKEKAGVELYTFYLAQALVQQNHQVHIFCRGEDPGREEFSTYEEAVDGLSVTRVVNNLTRISDPRVFYDNDFFDENFLRILKREKPDLVHFQHIIALSAHLPRIAKGEGVPAVLTLHDFFILCHRIHLLKKDHRPCQGPLYGFECVSCLEVDPPRARRTRFFLRVKDRLPFPAVKWTKRLFVPSGLLSEKGYEVFHRYRYMYEMFKVPDLLLTPSRFVYQVFLKYYPFLRPKLCILPLGIPRINGPKSSKKQDGKVRFCYFGNILPTKGLHVLVDAFGALPNGKATLTIYGERNPWTATYYDQLQKRACGLSVEFRGPFKREHVAEALEDQDVVVLPSICPESFSFVIREANYLGLPVIASRIGAIPEALEEGKNGLLFKPGDGEELKKCMLRFIEHPRLVQDMASRMPKTTFMSEHAKALVNLYQEILEKKR